MDRAGRADARLCGAPDGGQRREGGTGRAAGPGLGQRADAVAADSEAKRLKLRASSIENNVERLRALTLSAVKVLGKIKTPRFTIWAQKSKDTVSYSMSPDIMPDVFAAKYPNLSRTVIELDKNAVQELAKSGAVIPPEIVATEVSGHDFLQIR